ncbi:MAG: AAA family ATPase [Chloroflexi bacterium]|nr:AAA family ATPase [Chloroflexota bacterium]
MASRILLVSDSTDDAVAGALATPSHEVTRVADPEGAVGAEGEHEVIVVDLSGDFRDVIEACRIVRESPALATVPILALSQGDDIDERIGLLEAGVDDVMVRPFDPRELDARVEALVLRYQRSKGMGDHSSGAPVITVRDTTQQRLVAVFSPKGGVGTTTVAVNVAVALAARSPGRVVILDLDLQFGQVTTHLNIPPRLSIAELARDDVALRDPGVFQTYLDRHGSGLAVLAAPITPDGVSAVTESAIGRILETAGRAFQTVVVDAGSEITSRSEAVLGKATDIIVVVTPEFPALKAVHAMRERLDATSDQLAETTFILNQIFAREILRSRDIEEALGTKIAMTIPYDAFVFLKSVNEGVPVVVGAPRSAAAEQLNRLATRLSGIELEDPAAERRPKGLGALFGRG